MKGSPKSEVRSPKSDGLGTSLSRRAFLAGMVVAAVSVGDLALAEEVKVKPSWVTWREVTAYCPCRKCCGPKAPRPTASGKWPVAGRTAAANWLPFGTRIRVAGRVYVVQDRMGRAHPAGVDLFMDSHAAALRHGRQRLLVEVLP